MAYLRGRDDVSGLSPAEFRELSTQLAEKRMQKGSETVVYNNEAYISRTTT
jgi:transposase